MPILGEKRKYEIERASKERPARSNPLERQPSKWTDVLMQSLGFICLVLLILFILSFVIWPGFIQW